MKFIIPWDNGPIINSDTIISISVEEKESDSESVHSVVIKLNNGDQFSFGDIINYSEAYKLLLNIYKELE